MIWTSCSVVPALPFPHDIIQGQSPAVDCCLLFHSFSFLVPFTLPAWPILNRDLASFQKSNIPTFIINSSLLQLLVFSFFSNKSLLFHTLIRSAFIVCAVKKNPTHISFMLLIHFYIQPSVIHSTLIQSVYLFVLLHLNTSFLLHLTYLCFSWHAQLHIIVYQN